MNQPKQGVAYRYQGNAYHMTKGKIYPIEGYENDCIRLYDDAGDNVLLHHSAFRDFEEVDWKKATDEELLTEAKRKYPIGTNVTCLYRPTDEGFIAYDCHLSPNGIYANGSHKNEAYKIYDKKTGNWAEIIEEPKQVHFNYDDVPTIKPQEPKAGDMVEGSDNEQWWSPEPVYYVGQDSNGKHVVQTRQGLMTYLYIRLPEVDKAKEKALFYAKEYKESDMSVTLESIFEKAIEWAWNNPKTK